MNILRHSSVQTHILIVSLLSMGASAYATPCANVARYKIAKNRMLKMRDCCGQTGAEVAAREAWIDNQPASDSFNQAQDIRTEIFLDNMAEIEATVADIASQANK
jgi:hypothetical protein